ncbi:MAG TPA: MFS transporter [Chthoniobacterales bacterium]|nr:MFS transporter [Chthoniobacterales bacterium]
MNTNWTALRNPAFRRLWIASVVSGTCVAAHDHAATYAMNTLAASPFLISLISTVASLPFLLFTLPAGALADQVNRKKLVCLINLWLAIAAAVLAILGWLQLLNSYLILAGVFLLGIGFAFNAPTWTSIVPQVVSDAELPSAATLSGLQFNISGIVGPALGGFLVPLIGAHMVFIANAGCFLLVILSVLQWKQPKSASMARRENPSRSLSTATRYLRCAPELQILLVRNFLFALFISAIPAIVPVVGLKELHLDSSKLGLLFTSMGGGSVIAALFIVPWLRARFSPNTITLSANLLVILAYTLMALIRQTELFLLVAALAGVGWTLSASELWIAAQRAMPDWVRGRMNALIMMVSQGAMVLGGLIWGAAAAISGPASSLFGAAALFLISSLLSTKLSINFARNIRERVANCPSMKVKSPESGTAPLTTGLLVT